MNIKFLGYSASDSMITIEWIRPTKENLEQGRMSNNARRFHCFRETGLIISNEGNGSVSSELRLQVENYLKSKGINF